MNKKFITGALALSVLLPMTAFANNPTDNGNCQGPRPCATECPAPNDSTCGRCAGPDVFAGITLTETQRAAIDNLNNSRRQACRGRQDARRQDRQARAESARQELRRYLDRVKAILTPEQYVTFLENIALNQRRPGDRNSAQGRRGNGHRVHTDHGHHTRHTGVNR